jgi:hypothetical protein
MGCRNLSTAARLIARDALDLPCSPQRAANEQCADSRLS